MPASSFPDYARTLEEALARVIAAGEAVVSDLRIDQRSLLRGFIAGSLQFHDSSILHFREFVDVTEQEQRLTYAYHYQDADGSLIFRYDNAAHRPALPRPEHRHTPAGVVVSEAPTLSQVIDQILGSPGPGC